VLTMGDFSVELCGGTHVKNTGDIGLFTILSESSLATGVRRIEATTSETAVHYLSHRSSLFKKVEALFGDKEEKALAKVENLMRELKEKQKEIESLKDRIQANESKDLFDNLEKIGGIDIAIIETSIENDLRKMSDLFVNKYPNGALVIYNKNGAVLVRRGPLVSTLNAGEALKEILTVVNGRGGGKPDIAQGSGEAEKVALLKSHARSILSMKLA